MLLSYMTSWRGTCLCDTIAGAMDCRMAVRIGHFPLKVLSFDKALLISGGERASIKCFAQSFQRRIATVDAEHGDHPANQAV